MGIRYITAALDRDYFLASTSKVGRRDVREKTKLGRGRGEEARDQKKNNYLHIIAGGKEKGAS